MGRRGPPGRLREAIVTRCPKLHNAPALRSKVRSKIIFNVRCGRWSWSPIRTSKGQADKSASGVWPTRSMQASHAAAACLKQRPAARSQGINTSLSCVLEAVKETLSKRLTKGPGFRFLHTQSLVHAPRHLKHKHHSCSHAPPRGACQEGGAAVLEHRIAKPNNG